MNDHSPIGHHFEQAWAAFETMESWYSLSSSSNGSIFGCTWADGKGGAGTSLRNLATGETHTWDSAGLAIVELKAESLHSLAALTVAKARPGNLDFVVKIGDSTLSTPLEGDRWALVTISPDSYAAIPQHGAGKGIVLGSDSGFTLLDLRSVVVTSSLGAYGREIYVNAQYSEDDVRLLQVPLNGAPFKWGVEGTLGVRISGSWIATTTIADPNRISVNALPESSYEEGRQYTLQDISGNSTVCCISPDGSQIVLGHHDGLDDACYVIDLFSSESKRLNNHGTSFGVFSFFHDDRVYWVQSAIDSGPVLMEYSPIDRTVEERVSSPKLPWRSFVSVRNDRSSDGAVMLESVVIEPADEEDRHTTVVCLHGGPRSRWNLKYDQLLQTLVHSGCRVVAPNPRGSSWTERSFETALHGQWGRVDVRDVEAVVFALRRESPGEKYVIFGQSYGAYLGFQFLLNNPGTFDAAILGASFARPEDFFPEGPPETRKSLLAQHAVPSFWGEDAGISDLDGRPVWVIHGAHDQIVPLEHGRKVHDTLLERGAASSFDVVDDVDHQPFAGSFALHQKLQCFVQNTRDWK